MKRAPLIHVAAPRNAHTNGIAVHPTARAVARRRPEQPAVA